MELYLKAGKLAKAIRNKVTSIVRRGRKLIDICEEIEGEIERLGGRPAFPVNVGIDYVAAHYTSPPRDESLIPDGSLVKVDIGVHFNGRIADTAVTVSLGSEEEELITAAEEALDKAIQKISPKAKIADVSLAIERSVKSYGFKPIANLTGHELLPYVIHAGTTVPNVWSPQLTTLSAKFEPGHVYAIEPFTTLKDAAGEVENGPSSTIYRVVKFKPPKSELARLYSTIYENYRTLPFARRWVAKFVKEVKLLDQLLKDRVVAEYPVLVERSRKPVAQAEHTVLVLDDEVLVVT